MKKLLVVLLSLTLIFAFTGCTSSNNGATEDIEIKTQEVVHQIQMTMMIISVTQKTQ